MLRARPTLKVCQKVNQKVEMIAAPVYWKLQQRKHVRQLWYEEGKRNIPFRESDGESHDKLRIERSLRTVERKEGS